MGSFAAVNTLEYAPAAPCALREVFSEVVRSNGFQRLRLIHRGDGDCG